MRLKNQKPFTLGLDLDGVTGDYHGAFSRHAALYLGIAVESLPVLDEWSYSDSWGITNEQYNEIHNLAVEDGLFANMEPIEGAVKTLQELSASGVKIRIITHRLMVKGQYKKTVIDTVTWLDEHNIPYEDIAMLGDKKAIQADLYVDDAPHNIVNLREAGRTAAVFSQHYNRKVSGLRADSWDDVATIVARMRALATA